MKVASRLSSPHKPQPTGPAIVRGKSGSALSDPSRKPSRARAADTAVIVVSAVSGVEVGTERVWATADRFGMPVVTLVDTPGAYPGIDAEARGQAEAVLHLGGLALQLAEIPLVAQGCAGHLLGSAYVEVDLHYPETGEKKRIVFSGDLGAPHAPILPAPKAPYKADVLVIESTYGDRLHAHASERRQRLEDAIDRALADKGVKFQAISTSEIKISVLIDRKYMELAVQALHDTFELEKA